MPAVRFSKQALVDLKRAVQDEYPEVPSSHISESLAAALGFRTHAALLANLHATEVEPPYYLLEDEPFDRRLAELGHRSQSDFGFEMIALPGLINTRCPHAHTLNYKSLRDRAWRNIVVCAVNEGLRRKLFALAVDDNRWPTWNPNDKMARDEGALFEFELPNGLPALGYVSDAGFGELAVHVAVRPTEGKVAWVRSWNSGFSAGDAFAATWLERERGAWIQSSTSSFKCRRNLLAELAEIKVQPAGYGDRGRVIM